MVGKRKSWFFKRDILDEISQINDEETSDNTVAETNNTRPLDKSEINEMKASVQVLVEKNEQLNKKFYDMGLQQVDSNNDDSQVNEYIREIQEKTQENEQLKAKCQQLEHEKNELESEKEKLTAENQQLASHLQAAEASSQQLKIKNKDLETELSRLKGIEQPMTEEKMTQEFDGNSSLIASEPLEQESYELEKLVNENEKLRKEMQELEEWNEGAKQSQTVIDELQEKLHQQELLEKRRNKIEQMNATRIAELEPEGDRNQKVTDELASKEALAKDEPRDAAIFELQEKVRKLSEENDRLTMEQEQVQSEIGEVLLIAKRQAKRMIEEAEIESEQLIQSARIQTKTIRNRAEELVFELDESKHKVVTLYEDLQEKMHQLARSERFFEEVEK